MTEAPAKPSQTAAQTVGQGVRLLVDVGPVIAFVVAYNVARRFDPEAAVFWGTGIYMVAMVVAVTFSWFTQRRVPLILAVTSVIVLVFGGLTLAFQSPEFAYAKPTVINFLLAGLIVGSLMIGQNIWKIFFSSVFELPDRIWNILALRWAAWFVFLGLLNLAMWPNYWEGRDAFWLSWTGQDAETFWANFKLWGVMPMTFLFAMANVPITVKHGTVIEDANKEDGKAAE